MKRERSRAREHILSKALRVIAYIITFDNLISARAAAIGAGY